MGSELIHHKMLNYLKQVSFLLLSPFLVFIIIDRDYIIY